MMLIQYSVNSDWLFNTQASVLQAGGFIFLKAKRGFGQGILNWLKLSNMVQQGPSTLITNYCASMSNRNELLDNQN